MGVYIPNMKKERYCEECPLSGTRHIDIYDYVFCELLDEYVDEAKKHCPLIEIDLVRCGECKWYNPWHANHTNIDGNYCRNIDRPMKPTDFCSYGERRAE